MCFFVYIQCNNMKPDIWGRHLWLSLHFIALDFSDNPTDEDKLNYKLFFENLHQVIPCYKCSLNYKPNLQQRPITDKDTMNTKSLFKWTVDIHNLVNTELGKKQLSFDDAWIFYNDPSNFEKTNVSMYYYILAIIVMIILCFFVYFIFTQPFNTKRLLRTSLKTKR